MKAKVSFAGLEPSTGVPRIKRSNFSMADGSVDAMLRMGAFTVSAMLLLGVWYFLFLKSIIHKRSWFLDSDCSVYISFYKAMVLILIVLQSVFL